MELKPNLSVSYKEVRGHSVFAKTIKNGALSVEFRKVNIITS